MTLLDFNELPAGNSVSLQSTDQGVLSGVAVDPAAAIVTPANVGAVLAAANSNVRYVTKQGNDATGTGSEAQPFLTVQAAINSIAGASSTTPFEIEVGPGTYTDAFVVPPWIFIVGKGRNLTTLAPVQANWIAAGFSAAGTQRAGIIQCTIGANLIVDFSLVASPGAGQFFLLDSNFDNAGSSYIGGNSTNSATMMGCLQVGTTVGLTHLFRNLQANAGFCLLRTNNVTIDNTGAFAGTIISRLGALYENASGANGIVTISGTVGSTASLNSVILTSFGLQAADRLVITGDGVVVSGPAYYEVVGPDANTTFTASSALVGATHLIGSGLNFINATPTAPRTYSFGTGTIFSEGTQIQIKNHSAFVITIALSGSNVGNLSYVQPFGLLTITVASGTWMVQSVTQSGSVALTNGVSALIPCDVSATSNIVASLKTVSGAFGTPVCGGRIVGTRAGGGGFVITSTLPATLATVVTDQGTYDWFVNF